jgi:hypothetical protein
MENALNFNKAFLSNETLIKATEVLNYYYNNAIKNSKKIQNSKDINVNNKSN